MKKDEVNKIAFTYQPKPFKLRTSEVATDFVNLQKTKGSDFRIADVVAQQSGIKELEQKNIESRVEEAVLERLKEIQEQAYKQAYELGKVEGAEKALEESRADFADKLQRLDGLLKTVDESVTAISKESEIAIVKVIFEIAKRIAMREIGLAQEPIVTLLNELVQEVQGAEHISVKMNPQDFAFVEDLRQKGIKDVETLQQVKLQAAEEIQPGGCVIETNFGAIDATIEQRVAKAWTVVEERLPVIKRDNTAP